MMRTCVCVCVCVINFSSLGTSRNSKSSLTKLLVRFANLSHHQRISFTKLIVFHTLFGLARLEIAGELFAAKMEKIVSSPLLHLSCA